jgi:hypothetical protein
MPPQVWLRGVPYSEEKVRDIIAYYIAEADRFLVSDDSAAEAQVVRDCRERLAWLLESANLWDIRRIQSLGWVIFRATDSQLLQEEQIADAIAAHDDAWMKSGQDANKAKVERLADEIVALLGEDVVERLKATEARRRFNTRSRDRGEPKVSDDRFRRAWEILKRRRPA